MPFGTWEFPKPPSEKRREALSAGGSILGPVQRKGNPAAAIEADRGAGYRTPDSCGNRRSYRFCARRGKAKRNRWILFDGSHDWLTPAGKSPLKGLKAKPAKVDCERASKCRGNRREGKLPATGLGDRCSR
jgi:hypothetical protein